MHVYSSCWASVSNEKLGGGWEQRYLACTHSTCNLLNLSKQLQLLSFTTHGVTVYFTIPSLSSEGLHGQVGNRMP